MAPIVGTRCLRMGIVVFFTLAASLELEAPAATLGLNALVGTRVVVATDAGHAMVFLLCFNGLAEATSTTDGHFRLVFHHEGATLVASIFFFLAAFECLLGFFLAASSFLFFTASVNSSVPGTGRGP
jgi:hypothetical protein